MLKTVCVITQAEIAKMLSLFPMTNREVAAVNTVEQQCQPAQLSYVSMNLLRMYDINVVCFLKHIS